MTTIKRFTPDYKMHAVRFEAFAREAEHGEYVRFDAHQQKVSALEAERDALAVENAALKDACGGDGSYRDCPACAHSQYIESPETPATSAALAAIQALGVEKFADDLHKTAMSLCPVKPDNTAPGAYAGLARSFAKKLREGK
ncbi:TPA: hypothetical protein ACKQGK_004447 [Serratia marcescens]